MSIWCFLLLYVIVWHLNKCLSHLNKGYLLTYLLTYLLSILINYRQALSVLFSWADFWGFQGPFSGADQASRWIQQGGAYPLWVWVWGPKTLKIWNFSNIIIPKRWVLCTILIKFMCVLRLYNFAKVSCIRLINIMELNNLPRWGHFQPNFRWLPSG